MSSLPCSMTPAPRTTAAIRKFASAPDEPKHGQVVWLVGGFDFHEGGQYASFGRRCKLQGVVERYFQLLALQSGERVLSAYIVTPQDVRKDLQVLAQLKKSARERADAQARYLARLRIEPDDAAHWADVRVSLEGTPPSSVGPENDAGCSESSHADVKTKPAPVQDWDISPVTLLAAAQQRFGSEVAVSAPYFVDKRRVRVDITLSAGSVSFGADFLYRLGRFA